MDRQQDLHGETYALGLEDAVGVVEPQHVCGTRRGGWSNGSVSSWQTPPHSTRLLTHSRLRAGEGAVLGDQVSVVSLAGHDLLHLARLLPFPLLSLHEDPKANVCPLAGKLPPGGGRGG